MITFEEYVKLSCSKKYKKALWLKTEYHRFVELLSTPTEAKIEGRITNVYDTGDSDLFEIGNITNDLPISDRMGLVLKALKKRVRYTYKFEVLPEPEMTIEEYCGIVRQQKDVIMGYCHTPPKNVSLGYTPMDGHNA